jgi:hypothetical protein
MAEPTGEHYAALPVKRTIYSTVELLPNQDKPTDFRLVREPGAPQEPTEMADLRREYTRVFRLILVVFQNDEATRSEMITRIAEYLYVGLVGDNYDLGLGRENLDEIKEDLADAAYRTRTEWLRDYTRLALINVFLPTFLLGLVCYVLYLGLPDSTIYHAQIPVIIATFWIPAGAAFGVWIEFALRTGSRMEYQSVLNMDPDRWRPAQRILISIAVAFAFAFVLGLKIVQVGLGTVLLNDFADKRPEAALAIGGIAGLAFPYVRDLLTRLQPEAKDAPKGNESTP